MKELLASFELSSFAKEKGFNEPCYETYDREGQITKCDDLDYIKRNYGSLEKYLYCCNNQMQSGFVTAPTREQIQKWLRDNHNKVVCVYANASGYCWEIHKTPKFGGSHIKDCNLSGPNDSGCWNKHEEAFEDGLFEALKMIK